MDVLVALEGSILTCCVVLFNVLKSLSNILYISYNHCCFFRLSGCDLREISCEQLSSVLASTSTNVTELDLSGRDLQDEDIQHLCVGLENPNCELKTLRSVFLNLLNRRTIMSWQKYTRFT